MFTGGEERLQWLVRFWEKKSNPLVKWIIDIPFFQANKSIFGRNTIITHILTTIMIHGGITLITQDGGGEWVSITITILIAIVSLSFLNISIA